MSDGKKKRCRVCYGRGYLTCECWPGDCICGFGDEECEACGGTGDADWRDPDEYGLGFPEDDHAEPAP